MKEILFFGIYLLIGMFVIVCIAYTITSFARYITEEREKKKRMKEYDVIHPSEPKPGDVIVEKYEWNNPYMHDKFNYETVKSVIKNDRGEIYFKTYSSDFDGKKVETLPGKYTLHEIGKKYYSEDWVLVNHIELKRQ